MVQYYTKARIGIFEVTIFLRRRPTMYFIR